MNKLFSEADLKRIEEAVREAEGQTSGEIVPYAVHASDAYDDAMWRAGLLFGVLALFVFVLIHNFSAAWQQTELMQAAVGTLVAALVGVLLVRFVDGAKRLFAGKELIERRVQLRAEEAFLSEEVFDTKDRTGILLFVSLLEHHVVVLGDSGINAKVKQEEWNDVVRTIVDGMKSGKPADGMVSAIRQCGTLLKKEGVVRRIDDTDELSNRMRTSEE